MTIQKHNLLIVFIVLIVFLASFGYFLLKIQKKEASQDIYLNFLLEVYNKIQDNYWKKLSDQELANFFKLGTEKIIGRPQHLEANDRETLKEMLKRVLSQKPTAEEKERFAVDLAKLVLVNLQPFGRSALYSPTDEKTLVQRVENINPQTGKKEATVKPLPSRKSNLLTPEIAYIKISSFSPSTFAEFQKVSAEIDKSAGPELNSLILDLRGNVGGSIDLLPYFLGPFIGKDQYAYELFQQGKREPIKTLVGWLPSLVRYKKVVVLVDNMTQSSAEVMAAVLKRYNVGVLVGQTTRGWGTVEKVFEIKNQISPKRRYSIFLVHHLTLGDDNQPIEGRGVEPMIYINNPQWRKQLFAYFSSQSLVEAVDKLFNESRK